ncbi:MAG TPA: hypothetical protein VG013_34020 [Gemmataceae bacterium]|jgi:hypothetical protein|nr:hypothetical protein [Gemmataceae bacterium]
MPRRTHLLTVAALLTWAGAASAAPGMLDLIPEDAAAAIAIRNADDLGKKGDKFISDTGIEVPMRPSQLYDFLLGELRISAGVDRERPVALVAANPKIVGAKKLSDSGLQLLVLALPFTDRDKMASNFSIKAGDLKPDKVMPVEGNNYVKRLYVHGNHVFMGGDERAVVGVAKAKSLGRTLSAAQRRQFGSADLLIHIGTEGWGDDWTSFLRLAEAQLSGKDAETDSAAKQLLAALRSVRFGLVSVKVDSGLGLNLLAVFPKGNDQARKFLTAWRAGRGASSLAGLPDGAVIAAQAARGDGAQNAAIAKLLVGALLRDLPVRTRWLPAATEQPNFVGVFTEVWQRLKGHRVAVYRNADGRRQGLFSVVGILDTDDAARFLADMRQLARFSDGTSLDLSGKAAHEDDVAEVERLIVELGDRKFRTRESATTKLSLIGEPALPYLDKATTSDDAEVRRRAKDIKGRIRAAVAARREELMSKDLVGHVRPTFLFVPRAQTLNGRRIDVVKVKLSAKEAGAAGQLRQLFGPDWDTIRLAVHDKQVVVLVGSDTKLLAAALTTLKENRPGLAGARSLVPFTRHGDPAHKAEFHVSLQAALDLAHAEDLAGQGTKPQKSPALTSFALTVEPDRLQADIWLPASEVKAIAKEQKR